MIAKILPSELSGEIKAPLSKSFLIRAIFCAGLAGIKKPYDNIADAGEDVEAAKKAILAMNTDYVAINDDMIDKYIDCNESGATLRFLIPWALTKNREFFITGSDRLFQRPLEYYENLCKEKGFLFEKTADGIRLKGCLTSGEYVIDGSKTSQYISGMLMSLATLKGCSVIYIENEVASRPYIDLTIDVMKKFGVFVSWADDKTIIISGDQKYIQTEIEIEGDYTQAAYIDAINYLLPNSNISITGLDKNSCQGDKNYKKIFNDLINGKADILDNPDLGPILMVLQDEFGGKITGTERLKYKESDRRTLNNCADHRIIMAKAIKACKYGGIIENIEAVNKSWPGFWEALTKLGANITFI